MQCRAKPITRRLSHRQYFKTLIPYMFIDSRNVPDGETIPTDVCVVGGGPAGIAIAREFINQQFNVILLESGDKDFKPEYADLGDGETVGDPFTQLRDMRYRRFGGMSHTWNIVLHKGRIGVRYIPLDDIDFEKRDWVPFSGWPFSKNDILPYYERANKFCQLNEFDYDPGKWETDEAKATRFTGNRVMTSMFKFGPSDIYSNEYGQQIDQAHNITTYLNANAVELETDEPAGSVTHVHVACLTGTRFRIAAKHFILATGGLDNPRLLLMSNKNQKNGLGNQNDVVGRYFMDHPIVFGSTVTPSDRSIFGKMALYDKRRINNETVMAKYKLTDEALRNEKILHMSALIFPREKKFRTPARSSMMELVDAGRKRKLPDHLGKHLSNVLFHGADLVQSWYQYNYKKQQPYPSLAFGEWSLQKEQLKRYTKFEVMCQTEQAPHPDNRITLSTKTDRLGSPQIKLTNYWNEIELRSIKRGLEIFKEEFASAGLGSMETVYVGGRPEGRMSTHHNMGTTRMHEDPKFGVVDQHSRVHGISNLYVTGGSVFPTGGFANPTLTIIALAIRLADRIKEVV